MQNCIDSPNGAAISSPGLPPSGNPGYECAFCHHNPNGVASGRGHHNPVGVGIPLDGLPRVGAARPPSLGANPGLCSTRPVGAGLT
jgi:hypothetical protein